MLIAPSLVARFAPYRLVAEVLAVVLAFGAGYFKGGSDKFNELSADWARQQLAQSQQFAEQLKAQREELERLRLAERAKDVKYETDIRRISADRSRLLASLRERPERPAVPASGPTACAQTGATGAELYRPDAEFLIGEAARADELRAALERCQGGDIQSEGRMDH